MKTKHLLLGFAAACLVVFSVSAQNKKGNSAKKQTTQKETKQKAYNPSTERQLEVQPSQPAKPTPEQESNYYPPKQAPQETKAATTPQPANELKPVVVKGKGTTKKAEKGKK